MCKKLGEKVVKAWRLSWNVETLVEEGEAQMRAPATHGVSDVDCSHQPMQLATMVKCVVQEGEHDVDVAGVIRAIFKSGVTNNVVSDLNGAFCVDACRVHVEEVPVVVEVLLLQIATMVEQCICHCRRVVACVHLLILCSLRSVAAERERESSGVVLLDPKLA